MLVKALVLSLWINAVSSTTCVSSSSSASHVSRVRRPKGYDGNETIFVIDCDRGECCLESWRGVVIEATTTTALRVVHRLRRGALEIRYPTGDGWTVDGIEVGSEQTIRVFDGAQVQIYDGLTKIMDQVVVPEFQGTLILDEGSLARSREGLTTTVALGDHGGLLAQGRAAVGLMMRWHRWPTRKSLRQDIDRGVVSIQVRGSPRETDLLRWWLRAELGLDNITVTSSSDQGSIFDTLHLDRATRNPTRGALVALWDMIPDYLGLINATVTDAETKTRTGVLTTMTNRFDVGVVGKTKTGKSTLFNALLGLPLSPVDETIATGTTLKISRAPSCDAGGAPTFAMTVVVLDHAPAILGSELSKCTAYEDHLNERQAQLNSGNPECYASEDDVAVCENDISRLQEVLTTCRDATAKLKRIMDDTLEDSRRRRRRRTERTRDFEKFQADLSEVTDSRGGTNLIPKIVDTIDVAVCGVPILDYITLYDTPGMSDPTADRFENTKTTLPALDGWLHLVDASADDRDDLCEELEAMRLWVPADARHVMILNKVNLVGGSPTQLDRVLRDKRTTVCRQQTCGAADNDCGVVPGLNVQALSQFISKDAYSQYLKDDYYQYLKSHVVPPFPDDRDDHQPTHAKRRWWWGFSSSGTVAPREDHSLLRAAWLKLVSKNDTLLRDVVLDSSGLPAATRLLTNRVAESLEARDREAGAKLSGVLNDRAKAIEEKLDNIRRVVKKATGTDVAGMDEDVLAKVELEAQKQIPRLERDIHDVSVWRAVVSHAYDDGYKDATTSAVKKAATELRDRLSLMFVDKLLSPDDFRAAVVRRIKKQIFPWFGTFIVPLERWIEQPLVAVSSEVTTTMIRDYFDAIKASLDEKCGQFRLSNGGGTLECDAVPLQLVTNDVVAEALKHVRHITRAPLRSTRHDLIWRRESPTTKVSASSVEVSCGFFQPMTTCANRVADIVIASWAAPRSNLLRSYLVKWSDDLEQHLATTLSNLVNDPSRVNAYIEAKKADLTLFRNVKNISDTYTANVHKQSTLANFTKCISNVMSHDLSCVDDLKARVKPPPSPSPPGEDSIEFSSGRRRSFFFFYLKVLLWGLVSCLVCASVTFIMRDLIPALVDGFLDLRHGAPQPDAEDSDDDLMHRPLNEAMFNDLDLDEKIRTLRVSNTVSWRDDRSTPETTNDGVAVPFSTESHLLLTPSEKALFIKNLQLRAEILRGPTPSPPDQEEDAPSEADDSSTNSDAFVPVSSSSEP